MDILAFCRKRDISIKGFKISQTIDWNREHHDQSKVILHIELPDHCPKKYENAIGKTVDSCLVASLGRGLSEASFGRSISWASK